MPELPEVETTRLGIAPYLVGRNVSGLVVRQRRLRWPIPKILIRTLPGQRIESVQRRAKYLLVNTGAGSAVLHLGMSGSLRVLDSGTPADKHDHYDWLLDSGRLLRFTDPRRFGSLLWQPVGCTHELLAGLGPDLQQWTAAILHTLEGYLRDAGVARPDVEAAVLFAIIDGVSQHYVLDPDRYPLEAVIELVVARYAKPRRTAASSRGRRTT